MTEVQLPDFDDMLEIAKNIEYLTLKKLELEVIISEKESKAISHHIENTRVNGKVPSMEYAKLVWKPIGIDNELVPLREELAHIKSELEGKKATFDIYKSMIAVWQTESANKRAVSL